LATSREPLGLPGEVVWRIPPLSLTPAVDQPADAVALLAERTAAARGGTPVAPAELPALTRVANRLAGLPLALELAAARLRVLTAEQLADRLEVELAGGAGDLLDTIDAGRGHYDGRQRAGATDLAAELRHATLQATVDWSYRTLDPVAARLLRALSVFAGPVDLDAAGWMLAADPLTALTTLVDKSLLRTVPISITDSGPVQYGYGLLEPIRAFAARELAGAGAALRWCGTGGAASSGLRLGHGLGQWWRERGRAREARLWLFRLYGRMAETGEAVDDRLLATAYHVHSLQAGADGELTEQLRYAEQAEAIARRVGAPALIARVLASWCWSL